MKKFLIHMALVLVALVALPVLLLLDTRTSRGQSPNTSRDAAETTESRIKPTSLVREKRVETSRRPLSEVASRNVMLRNELNWTFGGKQQRGWYLYLPLIGRLLETKPDASSEMFAPALAEWQAKTGLAASGVLDDESLYAMIAKWQRERLKERTPAQPEQLITAPASDFFDPSRVDELRQVERQTYAAYKRMVTAAAADRTLGLALSAEGELAPGEKFLKIISSFRTREYQEKLRRESPHAGRAGLAVNSPHFTGRALDIYVGGQPVETNDPNRAIQVQSPVYLWLVNNAERFGFRPYYYEPWHWEYVGVSGKR